MGQLFSKKNKEVFSAPLGIDNPVTVQVLGICSALAVTAKLEPALTSRELPLVLHMFSYWDFLNYSLSFQDGIH